jgi:chorismate dehydratase
LKARIGSVPYLNSLPLFQGILISGGNLTLLFDYPTNLAHGLRRQSFQGALCPTLLALQSPKYQILPNHGIISRGPVGSVHIYSNKEAKDWKTVLLDTHSMSSVALCEVLCKKHFKNEAKIVGNVSAEEADAYLLIGDIDMNHEAPEGYQSWDLGQAWQELSGLPFLYAAWLVHEDIDTATRYILNDAYVNPRSEVLQEVLPEFLKNFKNLSQEEATDYLTKNIHYKIDDEVWEGFRTFVNYLDECRFLNNKEFIIASET